MRGNMYIRPWNKESERIFQQLARYGRAYTDDMNFVRSFGRRYSQFIDDDFMHVAHIKKKRKSIIVTPPKVNLIPIPTPTSQHTKFRKYQFYKIF